jgi:hypothetical protein
VGKEAKMLDWITNNWPTFSAILGLAGALGGVSVWGLRLRAIIRAFIAGIEVYSEEVAAGTAARNPKGSIQRAAEKAGVEKSLNKMVKQETEEKS